MNKYKRKKRGDVTNQDLNNLWGYSGERISKQPEDEFSSLNKDIDSNWLDLFLAINLINACPWYCPETGTG